jgi:hypothetical protein
MDFTYKVYVLTDAENNITAINSSAFLKDATGWTQIDEGTGDCYHHAQGNYLPKPFMTEKGAYRYLLASAAEDLISAGLAVLTDNPLVAEKTAAEIAAEVAALPPPPPDPISKLREQNEILTATIDTILSDILPAVAG